MHGAIRGCGLGVSTAVTLPFGCPQIFNEIGATQSLKRLVCYSTGGTVSALAKKALRTMGEEVPRRILPLVPSWKPLEVQTWLQQIGFNQYCQRFLVGCGPRGTCTHTRAHTRAHTV